MEYIIFGFLFLMLILTLVYDLSARVKRLEERVIELETARDDRSNISQS